MTQSGWICSRTHDTTTSQRCRIKISNIDSFGDEMTQCYGGEDFEIYKWSFCEILT